jgi:hypothetical protein
MSIPRIFQWPTPWIWGALVVLMAVNNHHFRFDEFVG